jgi:hypothetical protein
VFGVPNLVRRFPLGTNNLNNTTAAVGGSNTMTNSNFVHRHIISRAGFLYYQNSNKADNGNSKGYGNATMYNIASTDAESGTNDEFLPKFAVVHYMIRYN